MGSVALHGIPSDRKKTKLGGKKQWLIAELRNALVDVESAFAIVHKHEVL